MKRDAANTHRLSGACIYANATTVASCLHRGEVLGNMIHGS